MELRAVTPGGRGHTSGGARRQSGYFALYKEIAGEVLGGAQDGVGEEGLKKFLTSLVDTMSRRQDQRRHLADRAVGGKCGRGKDADAGAERQGRDVAAQVLRPRRGQGFLRGWHGVPGAKELSLAFVFLNRYLTSRAYGRGQ